MQETLNGIILKIIPQTGSSVLVVLFSKEYGKISGMFKGGKKKAALLQPCTVVEGQRFRRLSSQLGSLSLEAAFAPSGGCFGSFFRLNVLNYITEVLDKTLHEEEAHEALYAATELFLHKTASANITEDHLRGALAFYELELLSALGYGLSLSKELAVGGEDGTPLLYVSPKSGRAVSEKEGAPYKEKLLTLPALFGGKSEDMNDVFRLTGYFLEQALHGREVKARSEVLG